jgi:hypothetical protein
MEKLRPFLGLAVIIIVIGGLYWYVSQNELVPENQNQEEIEGGALESAEHGFSLSYSEGWQVADSMLPYVDSYNVYIPVEGEVPPFTHHNNVTNVSIFPDGVPTEGVFSQIAPINFTAGFEISQENSIMFVLDDGTPFAAYIRPVTLPVGWTEPGFVWVRIRVENLNASCFDDGTAVPLEQCDPFTGHEVRWSGTVNPEHWQEAFEVLNSMMLES